VRSSAFIGSLAFAGLAAFAAVRAAGAQVQPSPTASPALVAPSPTASATVAGVVPSQLSVMVTGDPADADFVQSRIRDALDRAIRPTLRPGAVVRYGPIAPLPPELAPGFETSVTVPVQIAGAADGADVDGASQVTVANVASAPFEPSLLLFDDDPEYVRGAGVLLRGTVDDQHPSRIYYYHENVGEPRRFVLLIAASAGAPARVAVTEVTAGPDGDVMGVGHSATQTFLLRKPRNEGIVVDLAPAETLVVRDLAAGDAQVVAAAVDVAVLTGGAVTVTIMAIPPEADPASFLDGPRLPADGHNRHGTFLLGAYGATSLAYAVGGPDASLTYGDRNHSPPNADPGDPGRDVGDYGVLHRITFDLTNPSDVPATAYLYEKPLGGGVRSSFLVNDVLQDLGCVRVPNRYQVGAYPLAARSRSALRVVTMTDGGSSYPLEVGVTATPPLPTTPPITAPDGCFPKPEAPSPPPSAVPSATPTLAPSATPSASATP
jgi:hypothetical protein